MADEEPKIFVDEDWKAQVQREKEQAAQKTDETPAAEEAADEFDQAFRDNPFMGLVQSIATQCLFALGLIAPEDSKQVYVDLGQAQYLIDTLLMLRDKTKGNLSAEEEGHLQEAVAELQRVYVARAQQVHEATMRQADAKLKGNK